MAGVGERIATGMPQHMGMDLEFEPGLASGPLNQLGKARGAEWRAPFRYKDTSRRNRRRARSSTPVSGCVAGVPCFTRRT
jgi:hypothetical protein